ncbi:uncharacterized protein SPPG_01761 [Spizellomyces punctatus DAOM BR117]|uniref:Uncharacterized protein n=1 Tax=Spizellomyces punctatus (strain DAOM BR117) TaxID=645134 RepID=A0A0L0HMM7_SPIPD|nr:uncharacterized protein SPPG_01761 [Spizellomyces punctatus DAOM BR117]KND02676.1 hypothetical protein SPPG_01761 [Spizellomyces punctatus DAOM BR117]|eukprot:XP_016610715.1 hypothetical protein SPPG_01761 [Spizellomyces punctatus DAOM BR117]
MALTVTTAKYVLVPIILATFIIYSGFCLYLHVTQIPGVSITLSSEIPTLPYFVFVVPYGADVANIFNRRAAQAQPLWQPFLVIDSQKERALGPNQASTFGEPLVNWFSLQNRSFVHNTAPSEALPNVSTLYVLDPEGRKWKPPHLQFVVSLNRSRLFTDPNGRPPASALLQMSLLGSRLTTEQDFGQTRPINVSALPENFNGFTDLRARAALSRDINPLVQEGSWGYETTYGIRAYEYKYLNGSHEIFYEIANVGQFQMPSADTIVVRVLLSSQWTTVYTEYQAISWSQTLSSIATSFQILLLTGLMFLFGQGRFSPYGLIHRLLPQSSMPTYVPLGTDEMSRFRFFVNEYLDTSVLGAAAAGLTGMVPPSRKRPLPVSAVSILAVIFATTAFILYMLALFGGNRDLFVKEVNFLTIANETEPADTRTTLGLGLWGYCRITRHTYQCSSEVPMFSSFNFNSTVVNQDAYPKKMNAIDFVLLLGASVFMAIAVFSRIVSFWLRSLNGTSDVVAPSTSMVALLSGFVAFATLISYYNSIKRNVEEWGNGWRGRLGIGVTIVGLAVLFNMVACALLMWELKIMRQKENDMEMWKRSSYGLDPSVVGHNDGRKSADAVTLAEMQEDGEDEEFPKRR